MRILIVSLLIIIFSHICTGQILPADTFRLYYLGGQSNMDGYGYNNALPDSLQKQFDHVWIFHGNPVGDDQDKGGLGIWEKLQPGHGTGFSSDHSKNYLSDRFGMELSFAAKLQELHPNQKIALIKYSRGGTSIDSLAAGRFGCWDPDYQGSTGINQYDHFLETMRNAFKSNDLDKNGKKDHFIPAGIVWMQGESDATYDEKIALEYYSNLKRLMDLIRASLHTDDLAVSIGKISDSWNDEDRKVWEYCDLVQSAQEKFARTDEKTAIIRSTRYYQYSDPWHYDSKGYIDLGEKFAISLFQLND